jgi:hypothetical protein
MGRIMKSIALVYESLIGLEFFLGRSDGLRGLWEGTIVVMGFRWDYLMTVALMLYYSL